MPLEHYCLSIANQPSQAPCPHVSLILRLPAISMTHSSANVQVVAQFESVMDSWISEVGKLLGDVDMPRRDANDVGPASELE